MRSITLKEALKLWQGRTEPKGEEHLPDAVLKSIAAHGDNDEVLNHLVMCNTCRRRLWALQESKDFSEKADDYVILLAAHTGIPQSAVWVTEDKKYKIELNRMVSEETKGVIIVQVQPPFNFEGKTICVKDAGERVLLCEQIDQSGEAASIVDGMDDLDLRRITISEI